MTADIFQGLFLAMTIVGSATGPTACTRNIAASFQTHRGAALAIALISTSVAAMLLPPLLAKVLAQHGRRGDFQCNVDGTPIGDPRFDPFFEACEALDAAVFVHALKPTDMDRLVGPAPLQQVLAYPTDVGLAAASVITTNLLVRRPGLRIAFSHGGGTLASLLPRLQKGWTVFPALRGQIEVAPVQQARRLFFDSLVFDPPTLQHLVEQIDDIYRPGSPDDWKWPAGRDDQWPSKPVKVVLSQPGGSGPDTVARLLCDGLAQALGQAFVIENKPGGQNLIGAQTVARSPADGYTLYFATTAALVTNSYLFKTLPYDPLKDFAPVSFVADSPFAIFVKADSPITSLQDLVARSRKAPGKLSIANEGPRTFGGMIAWLINARSKAQANLVSYSSVGMALRDIMGGHADAGGGGRGVEFAVRPAGPAAHAGRHHRRARCGLGTGPDGGRVPARCRDVEMSGWMVMAAPAATPTTVVARLNAEITRLLREPALRERILAVGPIAAPGGSPKEFEPFLHDEHRRLGRIAGEIGLLPECPPF